MNSEKGRPVTIISSSSQRLWRRRSTANRLMFVDSPEAISALLSKDSSAGTLDVPRIVIDRCSDLDRFLFLLSRPADELMSEILFVTPRETGFLALVESDRRVFYALSRSDVEFYLRSNELIGTAASLRPLTITASYEPLRATLHEAIALVASAYA